MKKSELLADIDPGSDVGESDTRLQHYFVKTSAFREVIEDHADLILGPKGSGKTAIFRMLAEPQFDIPELQDAVVIPAFNTHGSVFFQDLACSNGEVTELSLRRLWTAYILSIAGNHVAATYPSDTRVRGLKEALSSLGLLDDPPQTRSIWRSLFEVFSRLTRPSSLEGRVDLGEGMPGVEGRAEYENTPAPETATAAHTTAPWLGPLFDSDRLTQTIVDILESHGCRCWIAFDRLDEAFQDNRPLERIALRGLMRAHIDISSYSSALRTKLFLRSDVLDRITQGTGFVNITHLRTLRIRWSREHLHDIVLKRLLESDLMIQFLHMCGVQNREDVVPALMSPVVEVSKRKKQRKTIRPFAYMVERSVDASGEWNPRNVVSYLRAARSLEQARCQFADVQFDENPRPPIGQDTMVNAWQSLSKDRLIDTLYAEHNSLRASFERFKNGPQRFDRKWMADLFGMPEASGELAELISSLEYCGFIGQTGRTLYRIADLYRPALGLNPKWEDRVSGG